MVAIMGCMPAWPAWAQPAPASAARVEFDIPAGDLAVALDRLSTQAGIQFMYQPELVAGKQVKALSGQLAWQEALDRLLQGSGLDYKQINPTTIVIRKAAGGAKPSSSAVPASRSRPVVKEAAEPTTLQAVSVTGTRIRGGVTASPTITIGAQQIQDEGFSDLGEVIRSVPQNFSGGQNPGVTLPTSGSDSNQNISGGSAMDLRGLGPDATLTLLNGHRMSYGGFSQSVDISAIPVEAVERLEIVPDGASAIYGSDAVGGVANVILKRDFNGVTVAARYGGATEGGLITRGYNATAGTTWATGGLIAAGEKTSNDPIYSDQRDYTQSMYRPSTLWQGSSLRSGLFSLHQSLGNAVQLHLDAIRSDRDSNTALAYISTYRPYRAETKATLLSPSLEVWLQDDWTLTLSGAVGKEENFVAQPTVNSADGAITADAPEAFSNKSLTYEIGAEGPLFTLPGGEARLATGAGYRYNDYLDLLNGDTIYAGGDERSRFAYAELNLPLVKPEQGIGGVERLELTGAIRTEDGDYGRVTTPKLGVVYSPSADFSLKASWGKSFKAPTLSQRYFAGYTFYYPAVTFGGTDYSADATILALSGGNPDLHPERARTWSASLAFHPEALSQLETELTWFNIDYTQRVVLPLTGTDVLGNPIYADFVDYDPTGAAQATALAHGSNFYNYVGTPYDASKVVAIIDGRYTNASRQKIKGLDLSGSYRFDLGVGRLTIRGSASWLDSTQSLTAAQSPYDLAGTLFNPARLNSRAGAVWQQGGFTASLFGNYKSGVINTLDGKKSASFTTFDAALRYDTGARDDAWSNLALELSAQNLLDRAPPLYTPVSPHYTPYDSTNYSAVGRFVSVSVSKHW
jgi:outer membrane receptor protein involved in Fe transport